MEADAILRCLQLAAIRGPETLALIREAVEVSSGVGQHVASQFCACRSTTVRPECRRGQWVLPESACLLTRASKKAEPHRVSVRARQMKRVVPAAAPWTCSHQ